VTHGGDAVRGLGGGKMAVDGGRSTQTSGSGPMTLSYTRLRQIQSVSHRSTCILGGGGRRPMQKSTGVLPPLTLGSLIAPTAAATAACSTEVDTEVESSDAPQSASNSALQPLGVDQRTDPDPWDDSLFHFDDDCEPPTTVEAPLAPVPSTTVALSAPSTAVAPVQAPVPFVSLAALQGSVHSSSSPGKQVKRRRLKESRPRAPKSCSECGHLIDCPAYKGAHSRFVTGGKKCSYPSPLSAEDQVKAAKVVGRCYRECGDCESFLQSR